jgi:hypothetical protein
LTRMSWSAPRSNKDPCREWRRSWSCAAADCSNPSRPNSSYSRSSPAHFDSLIDPDTRAWLKKLMAAVELVTVTERITACRDPTDDKFLELAANGHADLIVSGDADLLALNPFRDIPIVTPAVFVQGGGR